MDLDGTVAIVTGASSGLGRAISNGLAAQGVKVALLARSRDKLAEVQGEIEQAGGTALVTPADVTDQEAVGQAVQQAVDQWDGLDIVVNNAGLGVFKRVEEMSVQEWDVQINVMLRGTFLVTKYALPHLYRRGRGHVIIISSLWAKRFCGMCAGYTAAKFGLRGFAQSLREEARPHKVRVTNVMPGTVDTPFFEKTEWETDLSHAMQPDDVAAVVLGALGLPDRAAIEEVVVQAVQPDPSTC